MSRIIHTDMYTARAAEILKAVKFYMYDGWGSSQMDRNARLATIEIQPNGEVTWVVSDNEWGYRRSTYASRRDDQKVRDWIALSMKHIIYRDFNRQYFNANKEWKRNNNRIITNLKHTSNNDEVIEPITVAEAYCVFDKLLNRKTFAKRWKKTMLKKIIGDERDPVATELEIAKREELAKLKEKFNNDKNDLNRKRYAAIEEARRAVCAEYDKLDTELAAAYKQACEELEDSLKFATNLPDFPA